MSYRRLADFLDELQCAGELVRVRVEVNPELEAAEITARLAHRGGPAVLFEKPAGRDMPLLANLLGTESRICRALGAESPADAAERFALLANPAEPPGWFEKLAAPSHAAALGGVAPRRVRSAACQRVVRFGSDVDLGTLPIVRSASQEPAGVITAGVLLSAHPDTHAQVAGRWDLQQLGPDRLAVCWADCDDPARLLAEYRTRGEKMPLVVALGGDPAVLLAASAPLPPGVDACTVAGLFGEKPLDVVPCRSVDLVAPADAEIVLEGYVDPDEPPVEAGPLCTPSGHAGRPRPAPAMHITAVTHRADPIFPAMVLGTPPHESCVIAAALARLFLPLAKLAIVELVDYNLPMYGAARHWAAVAIRKTYAGQARRVAHAAWGLRQMMFAKVLVVVDGEVDVHDDAGVLAAIAANVRPTRDVFFEEGPADPTDVATPPGDLGWKIGIDATAKLPGEHAGPWPEPVAVLKETRELVSRRWAEYGLPLEP